MGLEDRHLPDEGWQDMDTDLEADGGGHTLQSTMHFILTIIYI